MNPDDTVTDLDDGNPNPPLAPAELAYYLERHQGGRRDPDSYTWCAGYEPATALTCDLLTGHNTGHFNDSTGVWWI